ncbi:Hypothetical leucine rich repeat protein [Ectocarpus siliculosus]|uniref:Hypothetical leucine rich repeat protein n=1 Tax=Ectocarpus siliculosus TaxID=2880 RepID=D7G450_ECTSI|nr:Hypothetical leucine rich repeat protein [Ectocarpus siliculosus]|eukprot:CBJ33668.1 Hypothetical leucine rich repeat protein [Ectocarpus siliculosus]
MQAQHGLATLGSDLRSGLGTIGMAVMSEATGIRTDVREVKRDLASVRESVEDCRAENMEFFASFTAGLEAAQQGIEIMRSAPLEEARMSLKNFEGSKGNVRFLETAHSKALTALVQGHTLDVKLSAAVIAVSAGYIHMSKVDCPSEAKDFTVNATLANVISHFAPTWSDPSRASKADGKKTVSFLLNIVSCVRALPPESVPVLSNLDKRLLPAFGALCSAEPELRRMYHTVAGVAVRAMLEQQTMKGLFQLAEEVDVDVDACTSKESVIQALLASGKCLLPSGATSGQAVIKSNPPVPTRVSPVKAMPAPVRDARTDRTVLMELFNTTKGPSWTTSTAWGTSSSLGEWYGVTVNAEGRVTKLDLEKNNLTGPIPPSLGGLTALLLLRLDGNELSGAIPPELGRLTALTRLDLDGNNLSGPIPSALGGLTALRELYLNTNKLEVGSR